ncbi:MAG: hypothetical protein LBH68_06895 [Bifidobacteriaceae bacterium]|jgi:plasmid stability protein|nr:hypothetical protein [Bifidobacteriaceae bacterium]
MPTLMVRQLEQQTYEAIKQLAHKSNRSMEAEARALLGDAVRARTWWSQWVELTEPARGLDLAIPERSAPRQVDFE